MDTRKSWVKVIKKQWSKGSVLLGITGAMIGFALVNLSVWFFSLGISLLDMTLGIFRHIPVPILLGITASILGRIIPGSKEIYIFGVACIAAFCAVPAAFTIDEWVFNDPVSADQQILSRIYTDVLLVASGLLLEILIVGITALYKRLVGASII